MSLLYFVVRVRCRRTESSRLLSHLLMSFLSTIVDYHFLTGKIFFLLCVLYHSFLQCRWRLRLEIRTERIILKVPQCKFWCPVCAPAQKNSGAAATERLPKYPHTWSFLVQYCC